LLPQAILSDFVTPTRPLARFQTGSLIEGSNGASASLG
jgi:hypothetical protein